MQNVAVITGGTKGIGRAMVMKLLSEGFRVYACSRNKSDLEQLAREAGENDQLVLRVADISKREEVKQFSEWILSETDRVDILVNNAGVFVPGQLHREEEGILEKTIETNVYGAYYLTRDLLPVMISHRRGHIFNLCSTASFVPYVNGGSYCISKYALLGFSRVLREEMKPYGIRVTSVMPGATLTASWEGTDLPEDRFMPPEDVARAIWDAWSLSGRTVMEELILRPMEGDIP